MAQPSYLIPVGNAEHEDGRRRILKIEGVRSGRKRAWLRFVDSVDGVYRIPLGRVDTVPKGTEKAEWDTVIVPVVPLRYTTAADAETSLKQRRSHAAALRPGWLYIYKDGHLWRELEIDTRNFARDVNLTRYQGQDLRPAAVEPDNRILIPYKIDNKKPAIQVCYAEVQWSWARINQLGGLAPDDWRLQATTPMPDAAQQARTERLRRARMGENIDFSSYPQGFKIDTDALGPIDAARCYTAKLHHGTKIPALYLEDPLGLARGLHATFYSAAIEQAKYLQTQYTPAIISHIDDTLLKHYPDYAKHLRENERQAFKTRYQHDVERLGQDVLRALEADIDYRTTAPGKAQLDSVLADYDFTQHLPFGELVHAHGPLFEQLLRDLLIALDLIKRGRAYLRTLYSHEGGPVQRFLSLKDKATEATNALLQLLADPLAISPSGWTVLSRYVETRYHLRLEQFQVSLIDFEHGLHPQTSLVTTTAFEASVVARGHIPEETPPKVWAIRVNGEELNTLVRNATHSQLYAGALFALQTFNFYRAAKDLGRHFNDKTGKLKWVQIFVELVGSIYGTVSASIDVYAAYLHQRAGMARLEIEKTQLRAAAKGAERAALRYAALAAFVESIVDLLHIPAQYRLGNRVAAEDYGIMAAGAFTSGVGLWLLGAELLSNPLGWMVILGGIAVSLFGSGRLGDDLFKPLENWMVHGYWGKRAYQDEARQADGAILYFADWQGHLDAELHAYYRIVYLSHYASFWSTMRPTGYINGVLQYDPGHYVLILFPQGYDPHTSRFYVQVMAEPSGEVLLDKMHPVSATYRGGGGHTPATVRWELPVPWATTLIRTTVVYDPIGDGSLLLPDGGMTFTLHWGGGTVGRLPLEHRDEAE